MKMTEKELMFSESDRDKLLSQEFQRRLNAEPNPAEFELTPDGKAKTLPISFVEMTLDEIYLGQWELSDPSYQQIFNEVVGTATLTVWHPITGRGLKRAGFASVVITQDKDAAIADFNMTKKKNALDLTFPKLKAEILKNAAASLGKIFGRDINRKKKDSFRPELKPLGGQAFIDLVSRVEKGDSAAAILAENYFILDEIQKDVLKGAQQKQIG
jgi:hypothetical protein